MYSLKALLTREPAAIVAVLTQGFTVANLAGWVNWSTDLTVAVESLVLSFLLLLWVRQASTPNVRVDEKIENAKALQKAEFTNLLLAPPDPEPEAAQKVAAKKTAKKVPATK